MRVVWCHCALGLLVSTALTSSMIAGDGRRPASSGTTDATTPLDWQISEANGQVSERDQLLRTLVSREPAPNLARWSLGYSQVGDHWKSVDEISAATASDSQYVPFVSRLHACGRNADEYLKLARQLRTEGRGALADCALHVAVTLNPGLVEAQKMLGRSQHADHWWTPEEWKSLLNRSTQVKQDARKWKPRVIALRNRIETSQKARQTLDAFIAAERIEDPAAIPVLETFLSEHSEACAQFVVVCVGSMSHLEATSSLVRHAVWSSFGSARSSAIASLQQREPESYVPLLIDLLRPTQSSSQWSYDVHGRPYHLWTWQSHDTTFRHFTSGTLAVRAPNSARSIRTGKSAGLAVADTETAFAANAARNQIRIQNAATALANVTTEDFGPIQLDWRRWWIQRNGGFFDVDAALADVDLPFTQNSATPLDLVTIVTTGIAQSQHACFKAGTPVWTMAGSKSIDKIELGEPVLSLNVETGELTFKPVVRRTVVPRERFRRIEVNGESIDATTPHPFWVAGKGWVVASKLSTSAKLRTDGSIVPMQGFGDGGEGLAYNLEVADFATYFVGNTRILVHDYSPIREAPRPVPGMPASTAITH